VSSIFSVKNVLKTFLKIFITKAERDKGREPRRKGGGGAGGGRRAAESGRNRGKLCNIVQ